MSRLANSLARLTGAPPIVIEPADCRSLKMLRPFTKSQSQAGTCLVHRKELKLPIGATMADFAYFMGDSRLDGFNLEEALFFDIETTGLNSGAGTLAFLIGLAFVEDKKLIFEQLFLDCPINETPLLEHFLARVNRAQYLVSFNGKSFDLSILQSRLVITRTQSRLESELRLRPHLDLLHVSRCAYRDVFSNGRLQTLEREVLGHSAHLRADDIPGALIPAVYFHFLQTSESSQLDAVFRHNEIDVVSMVELTLHLSELIPKPPLNVDAKVLVNLGKRALRHKQNERAAHLLTRATESHVLTSEIHYQALELLVTAHRRANNLEGALRAARDCLQWLPQQAALSHAKCCRRIRLYHGRLERKKHLIGKPAQA